MWGKCNVGVAWQGEGNKESKNKRTVTVQNTEIGKSFYGYNMMLMDFTSYVFCTQRFPQKKTKETTTE
jgi:hypothetical protein